MVKIYRLTHPTSSRFYIGKTSRKLDERLKDHLWHSKTASTRKNNWIKSLRKKELRPQINLIAEVDDNEWEKWEKFYIKLARQVAPDDVLNDPSAVGGKGSNFNHLGGKLSRKKHQYKVYKKNCPECKKDFITKRNKIIYCSKSCVSKSLYKAKREKMKSINTKLSSIGLEIIMRRINNGEYVKDIARDYSMNPESISRRLNGKTSLNSKLQFKKNKGSLKLAKLNLDIANLIRKRYQFEEITQKQLSKEYDIDASIVSEIISNKRWKNNQGE